MTIGSKSLSLTFPQISFATVSEMSERVRQNLNDLSSSSMNSIRNSSGMKKIFKNKYVIPGVVIVVILLIAVALMTHQSTQATSTTSGDARPSVEKPLATQTLNKVYSFPIKDTTGKQVSTFKYTIESAEIRDEIILNGQRVPTVQGRTMLILNVKLTNDYNKPVSVNARDYLRLTVNKNSERLAPDIHNDPVESQAMSTEPTRVGFFVNDTDKNFTLYVGQYVGDNTDKKDKIVLTLKK